jgi:hypothetical protein
VGEGDRALARWKGGGDDATHRAREIIRCAARPLHRPSGGPPPPLRFTCDPLAADFLLGGRRDGEASGQSGEEVRDNGMKC